MLSELAVGLKKNRERERERYSSTVQREKIGGKLVDVLEMREREKETISRPHVDKALFPAFSRRKTRHVNYPMQGSLDSEKPPRR